MIKGEKRNEIVEIVLWMCVLVKNCFGFLGLLEGEKECLGGKREFNELVKGCCEM